MCTCAPVCICTHVTRRERLCVCVCSCMCTHAHVHTICVHMSGASAMLQTCVRFRECVASAVLKGNNSRELCPSLFQFPCNTKRCKILCTLHKVNASSTIYVIIISYNLSCKQKEASIKYSFSIKFTYTTFPGKCH